jgi:hypothetical protein
LSVHCASPQPRGRLFRGSGNLSVFEIKQAPSLSPDPFANLAAGDGILVVKIPFDEREKFGWKDVALSQIINFADRLAAFNYTSQASHVALFLGERNGKHWFLNNTAEHGPLIIQESEFIRLYGGSDMDVARPVEIPISRMKGTRAGRLRMSSGISRSTIYGQRTA